MSEEIKRRKFLTTLGILGTAALAAPVQAGAEKPFNDEDQAEGVSILKAGPYLQAPTNNQITVRWLTNPPCYSWVEYGETKDNLDRKAETINDGMVEAYNTMHTIRLSGLQPGHTYHYRICSKEIESFKPYKLVYGDSFASEIYSFKTPELQAEKASFLVFNDIHDRPESFNQLMKFTGNEERDFVFLNGDIFNHQTDEDQLVDHLLKPVSNLFATHTPFFFSRGNHETRGKFARRLTNYFDGGENAFYYSFQYGPVYAIVLDSGEDKADDALAYWGLADFDKYRLRQAEWLKKEIQKRAFKKAKYKIVFSHIPLFYSGDWHGTMHCRKVWGPILNEAKIDLLISGHTHRYGTYPKVPGQHEYPIAIGGGPKDGTRTVMKIKADRNAFKLDMIDDRGVVVKSITI